LHYAGDQVSRKRRKRRKRNSGKHQSFRVFRVFRGLIQRAAADLGFRNAAMAQTVSSSRLKAASNCKTVSGFLET
jgi:hypothetical protein